MCCSPSTGRKRGRCCRHFTRSSTSCCSIHRRSWRSTTRCCSPTSSTASFWSSRRAAPTAARCGGVRRSWNRFADVHLLVNEVNRHYTRSNNSAIDRARGQYLCLLNNDTLMLPHAFDRMLAFLRQHPEAGAVGSRLLNEDGTTQWSVKALPN